LLQPCVYMIYAEGNGCRQNLHDGDAEPFSMTAVW
jgi:hypothetical protein